MLVRQQDRAVRLRAVLLTIGAALGALTAEAQPAPSELALRLGADGTVQEARASSVRVGAVLARLRALLKLEIDASPELEGRLVSLDIQDRPLPLEDLLVRLAPVVSVDYRHRADEEAQRLAVRLRRQHEAPAKPKLLGAIVLEGNTETDQPPTPTAAEPQPVPPEGPYLHVSVAAGRVSVSARQQGLGVILYEVARAYGVPFEMRAVEAPRVEQLDVTEVKASDLPALLGGGAGADVRRDLTSGEEQPLRFFLADRSPPRG